MKPGRLRERITFQSAVKVSNGAGGQTTTWANIADTPTVFAEAVSKSTAEVFEEGRMNARGSVVFRIRYRSDITEAMRIIWRGVLYNIRGLPDNSPSVLYMRIEAERGV